MAVFRIRFKAVHVFIVRHRERMVARHPAAFFFGVFEHREVHHPEGLPGVFKETVLLAEFAVTDLQTQGTQAVVNDLRLVGAEEDDVARFRVDGVQNAFEDFVGDVFDDRALQTFAAGGAVVHLDVGEALGAVDLHEFRVGVDFGARHRAGVGNLQGHHFAVMQRLHAGEDLELAVLHEIRDFHELELHAKVGLIRTEARHGFVVGHDGEAGFRGHQIHVEALLEDGANHVFHEFADFEFGEEARFDIDLREFGLTVGTEVFVAEALHDLIVTVKASHHQKLLKELRRLRQREEVTVLHAARYEVVAGAFRGGLGENRRFDVDEAVIVQEVAHGLRDLKAQFEVLLHVFAAKIEHAVRETRGFAHRVVVQLEGNLLGGVENRQLAAEHFDAARNEGFVLGAFRTGAHETHYLEAVFVAHLVGRGEHLRIVGVAHHLNQTFAVAEVDEDHAAVVTATVSPPVEGDGLADVLLINQATVNGTHLSTPSF